MFQCLVYSLSLCELMKVTPFMLSIWRLPVYYSLWHVSFHQNTGMLPASLIKFQQFCFFTLAPISGILTGRFSPNCLVVAGSIHHALYTIHVPRHLSPQTPIPPWSLYLECLDELALCQYMASRCVWCHLGCVGSEHRLLTGLHTTATPWTTTTSLMSLLHSSV